MKKKIVLAYSGGLDTSVILKWLSEKGFEVIAFIADVGQSENFSEVKEKAMKIGASKVVVKDLRRKFVTDYIFPAIKANASYEGRYLLGTALARPLIAKAQVELASEEGTVYISHGSTGKGNDQVRFELAYYALNPEVSVISPWKEREFLTQFKGRTDMLQYAGMKGIPVKATTGKPYSEDDNLMHISHEAGILEDPGYYPGSQILSRIKSPQEAPDKALKISIGFKDGIPVSLSDKRRTKSYHDPLEIMTQLNTMGSENGIGYLDMVENRYIGIKSRGIYETPGATILYHAHQDLEGIAMDREVMRLRNMLSPKFAEIVYNGYWFSPEMDFLMAAINKSQEYIDGEVNLSLYKGNVIIESRNSPSSLYNEELSSMDIEGGFDQADSSGFIKINAIRLMAHRAIIQKKLIQQKKETYEETMG